MNYFLNTPIIDHRFENQGPNNITAISHTAAAGFLFALHHIT